MMISIIKFVLPASISIIITLFLSGCRSESDPIISPADHFQPEGILLTTSGDTVVYYFQGTIRSGDTLKAPAGNNLSPHYTLRFLDANKQQISPPSTATHRLGWTIAHNNIAELYRDPGDEWNFHIRGKDSGSTTITLRVLHGDHADFMTAPIPVHVSPSFVGQAAGVLILDEGTGDTVATATSQAVIGTFTVRRDSITDHMTIYFIDDEGIKFQPPGSQYALDFEILNPSVAEIIPAGISEPWAFQLRGMEAGNTKVRFSLLMNSIVEYVAPDIDIIVLL